MISRSSPSTRKALSASSSTPSTLTSPPTPHPSRLSRFLSSLQPLPPTSPPSSHSRTSHRVLSYLTLTPPSASLISTALSHTHLDPLTALTLHHTAACQDSIHQLMQGLSSHHTTLTCLTLHHCPPTLHFPSLIHRLPLLPSLTSLSLWACDLTSLHRHDVVTLLSLPHLTALDLSATSLTPSALHTLTSALCSPAPPPLTSLDLSATSLDPTSFHSIAAALTSPHPSMTSLTLHSNPTSLPTLLHLTSALNTNPTLTHLDLRWTAPLTATTTSTTPPLPLDTLLAYLSSNHSLTTLLLCGYADPFTANLQSAIDLALLRNRRRPTTEERAAGTAQGSDGRETRTISLEEWDNPLHGKVGGMRLSPPLSSFRSYSNSLSSTSPFSLSLEPVPAAQGGGGGGGGDGGGGGGVGSGSANSGGVGGATVDGKLSSVVLQQEEEIARQGRIIARLRAMVKRQEEGLKVGRAQLRRYKSGGAGTAAPPSVVPPRDGEGVTGVGVESPVESPVGSGRGSLSSASTESSGEQMGGGEGEDEVGEGGGGEFRVNLDLAATVVLLESEKNEQQRVMDEMRMAMHKQVGGEEKQQDRLDAAPAQATDASPTSPLSPLTILAPPSPAPIVAPSTTTPTPDPSPAEESDRGHLIAEVTELRAQVAHLQAVQRAAGQGVVVGLRRDSGMHWAAVVQSMREEGERQVREREEKIQALLSAQRVLAESREVKAQQAVREWREKEVGWENERERLREEVRRLRKRLNRVSLESRGRTGGLGSRQGSVRLGAAPLQGVAGGAGASEAAGAGGGEGGTQSAESEDEEEEEDESSSSDESASGSPRFHPAPQLSATQPLPSMSPPQPPTKPPHSLGLVIAARIAAFESRRGEESESIRERMGLGKGAGGDLLNRKRSAAAEEEEKMPD